MKLRRIAAVGLVAAVAGVTVSAVASAKGTARATTAASKAPIVIGNVGTYSGPNGEGGTVAGLTAWADWTNAHGGISGHKVILKTYDDGGNGTTTLADVQSLIAKDHVVVMLDNFTNSPTWETYATNKGVPTISADPYYGTGLSFSASTTLGGFANSLVLAGASGSRHLGYVLCQEFSVCDTYANGFKTEAAKLGVPATVFQVLTSTPDFTATCLALESAGADTVTVGLAPSAIITMANNCHTQNYNPRYVIGANTIDTAVTQTAALNGAYATAIDFPWFEADTPATKQFQAAVRQYVPAAVASPADYNNNMSQAWAAGKVLAVAAAGVGPAPTSKQIIAGLLKIKKQDFGGLTPPLTFASPTFSLKNPSKYVQPAVSCYFKIELLNGHWEKPPGLSTTLQCP